MGTHQLYELEHSEHLVYKTFGACGLGFYMHVHIEAIH